MHRDDPPAARDALAISDFDARDLSQIGWSGTPTHVRNVARELERVADGDAEYLAARAREGAPVAACGIDYTSFDGAGVIHQLAVREDLQGVGIGTNLIAAAETRIRRRGLTTAMVSVEPDNTRARALYERLGYVVCGTRRVSWEAERSDGSTYVHETDLIDMKKSIT
jgi:ribosomal protein S18 acetylase RimI-like enzyme